MASVNKEKLSVLIITLNEEKNIGDLLEDLSFADEIIVIDSFSKDQTVEIVTAFKNVKLIQNEFVNFTAQRNFAIDKAKNNWVLFIDADERMTPELKLEIIQTINSSSSVSAYLVYRTFMFKNTKLRFSGWQTDKIYRLFKKDKCRYTEERLVHEKLNIEGEVKVLKHKLIHYSYLNYEDYKKKMISYGKLKSLEKYKKRLKPSFLLMLLHPLYTFLYQFIIRLGFLDGRNGILICYLNAYSVYIRYKELKKITSKT